MSQCVVIDFRCVFSRVNKRRKSPVTTTKQKKKKHKMRLLSTSIVTLLLVFLFTIENFKLVIGYQIAVEPQHTLKYNGQTVSIYCLCFCCFSWYVHCVLLSNSPKINIAPNTDHRKKHHKAVHADGKMAESKKEINAAQHQNIIFTEP